MVGEVRDGGTAQGFALLSGWPHWRTVFSSRKMWLRVISCYWRVSNYLGQISSSQILGEPGTHKRLDFPPYGGVCIVVHSKGVCVSSSSEWTFWSVSTLLLCLTSGVLVDISRSPRLIIPLKSKDTISHYITSSINFVEVHCPFVSNFTITLLHYLSDLKLL